MRNRIITVFFLIVVIATATGLKSYNLFGDIVQSIMTIHFQNRISTEERKQLIASSMSDVNVNNESMVLDTVPFKTNMVRLNGSILKNVGIRSYYNRYKGMNITTTGYNIGRYDETTTDYEVQEIISFKEYLDSKGINLLYVSEPAKYIDDQYYTEQFGGKTYINENTNLFLSRIGEAGVNYLDLRDCIRDENLDSMQLFYKTDHHWTVPASRWAAEKIVWKLNTDFGYNVDMALYDANNFNSVSYRNCWLGEQGRLVADTYIGLDDYTMMEPLYDTSFSVISGTGEIISEGNFEIFINKGIYTANSDYYNSPSWHYSYGAYNGYKVHNNVVSGGNILIIGDSYEASMAPFLMLGVENVTLVILRDIGGSVRDILETNQYDTVIIAYAQFMIGAHDDEASANYRMFTFD